MLIFNLIIRGQTIMISSRFKNALNATIAAAVIIISDHYIGFTIRTSMQVLSS